MLPEMSRGGALVKENRGSFAKRILINDFCGHPFQVELSRELARRGHTVAHVYSADDQTPKGDLLRGPGDPASFAIEGVTLGEPLEKYKSLVKRRRHERAYGQRMCRQIDVFKPDVVVGSNNPLDAQNRIGSHCRSKTIPFVFWLQDIHSDAIKSFLSQKSTAAATLVGNWYERMERRTLRNADHIVAISDNFGPRLESWKIDQSRISVIENWAPKEKIKVVPKDNPWSREHGLANKRVALYTGTIGLKHNPDLLLAAAESVQSLSDVQIVIVSQGKYADYLRQSCARKGLGNMKVLPFQPFGAYSEVLASGDVLMAMIEEDAAHFSVPSKVLSYLCSAKAIVLAADERNLAARIVNRAQAGAVVSPRDMAGFVRALQHYLSDESERVNAGMRGRCYADKAFDIGTIADRFEGIFQQILA